MIAYLCSLYHHTAVLDVVGLLSLQTSGYNVQVWHYCTGTQVFTGVCISAGVQRDRALQQVASYQPLCAVLSSICRTSMLPTSWVSEVMASCYLICRNHMMSCDPYVVMMCCLVALTIPPSPGYGHLLCRVSLPLPSPPHYPGRGLNTSHRCTRYCLP